MKNDPINPRAARGGGRSELPAYLSNGLIGLRVPDMPLAGGLAMISGYAGEHPKEKIEAAASVPYPLWGNIAIDGVLLSDAPHCARVIDQKYDFSCGELTTRFGFSGNGAVASIEVLTFCNRRQPTIVCQQIEVSVDKPCNVTISGGLATAGIEGRAQRLNQDLPARDGKVDGALRWCSAGDISSCGIAYVTRLQGANNSTRNLVRHVDHLATCYSFKAKPEQRYRLTQLTSLIPSIMHDQPEMQAARLVAMSAEIGFDALRAQNRAEWEDLWKGRIKLIGADRHWQAMADAGFFYLNCSAHASSPSSTSIFGLATWKNYHYYYGHVMWDIESFVIPAVTLFQPHAAMSMLEYRFRCLDGARRNAHLFGRRGLSFPWESAPFAGHEAAPLPGTGSWHADHVSLDVALAFAFYANVTGDQQFLRDKAWPVLSGVAEWIASRVTKTRRGYEFKRAMGIAERKEPVDNPAHMNMAAKLTLRHTLRTAATLDKPRNPAWAEIADGLVLPERDDVIVSHDDYDRGEEKGATPDPLMGIFPAGYRLSPEQEQATLDFYLACAEDYVGSPMLSALYGVWAAWSGNRKLAAKLLEEGYGKFMAERFSQTLEYRRDRFPEQPMAGPFFANIAGFLVSLVLGFPGLSVEAGEVGEWHQRTVTLPHGWKAIEVDRLWIRGKAARLYAEHGAAKAELEFLSGD
jgi:trehalose/maltose hydrolase-like predicted phosphorylase